MIRQAEAEIAVVADEQLTSADAFGPERPGSVPFLATRCIKRRPDMLSTAGRTAAWAEGG